MKTHSPLLGFNTNVRHKGKVFHIQTEDSGVKHPHIITHLFADGGRILKSVKTSYAEHLEQDNLTDTVRTMMKDQHKAMFMALRDGTFDSLIDDVGGSPEAARSTASAAQPRARAASTGALPVSSVRNAPLPAAETAGPLSVRADPAAAQAWSGVDPKAAALPPGSSTAGFGGAAPGAPAPESIARYAASRPAAIFASARPAEGRNVFGEDMISDKSLDEVILSFLAEEFGTNPGDKSGSGAR